MLLTPRDPSTAAEGAGRQKSKSQAGHPVPSVSALQWTPIESLNTRYGVIQDPAVLVLKPPGDLVVRIDGFADRDTVAQAAVNAAAAA
jgi:hypothetical protein